ncbi:MAG: hypothetical protein GF329_09990, partial [Candidatus Lokiarchaeota archaeon]|nr:hypothetical protein [Candidatus Lokiarchaeota archaeon]
MENQINKYEILFDDNHLIDKIETSWMGTDFTPAVDVKESFKIIIDDEIIDIDIVEDYEPFSILVLNKNCEIKRSLRENFVFPNPEIVLKIENKDTKKHKIKLSWKIKSQNNYALIKEILSDDYVYNKMAYLFF